MPPTMSEWIRCPVCGSKTRLQIREDTELKNFPLFCPKCKAVWTAVNDGKDQINYPTDSVCQKLYDQYQSMNVENFKTYFYDRIFGGAAQ